MSDLVSIRDRARFSGPTMRSGVIPRSRLDDRYRSATGRVLRVLAPGGYGKSTQVLRWISGDDRRARWLDLEPIDNDPLVLAHVIARGFIDRRVPEPGPGSAGPAPFRDLPQLIALLDEPFVLVLDDVHHIVNEQSAGLIDLLIDHLPSDSTVVLVGRAQHFSDSIPRQRLQPGVVDVGAEDLAFDLAETEEMLTEIGIESDIDVLTALAEQFEGWPAGLRLAGQVMVTHRGETAIPLDTLGDLAFVTDYVTQEWFAALDPDDQMLLAELGCLERFSGAQCDVVLGRRDSAAALRRLCHDKLMLIGLDQHDEWYRMHAVLARWLSSRLRSVDPARWQEIHLAAAAWWSAEGDPDLAIGHAATAGDADRVEGLVVQHCGPYAARGMYQTLKRWLDHFDEERVRESLPLKQVKAVLSIGLGDGEQALGWARLCRTELQMVPPTPAAEVLSYQTDALLATLENRPASELLSRARDAARHLPHGEWRALACLALGSNMFLCGHEGAIELVREALFENEVAHSTTLQATAAATLAIMLDIGGSIDEATELSDRANRLLATPLGRDASATAITLAIASLVDARSGRHDDAATRSDAARTKLAGFDRSAPWFGILGRIPLIQTRLLLDDAISALDLQRELEIRMEIQDATTPLANCVDALGARVRTAHAAFADRSWALTDAELRVLQHLPTNLSLADIATRLYVSRNTVKSHAAAIYRKLGTTSRTDAVELAREAGLLGETPSGV